MTAVDLRIAGGDVVTAETVLAADVLVADGTIVGVVDRDTGPTAERVVDVHGDLLLPGVVDPHVHVDGPNSIDSYETASAAAALGGVTSFVTFAWQPWDGPGSHRDTDGAVSDGVARQRRLGERSRVDFGLHGTVTREDSDALDEIPALVDDGITSFKLFTTYEFGLSNGFIEEVFERIAAADAVAVVHTEDDSVCTRRTERAREAGRAEPTDYPASRPPHAEAMAADDALRLARAADTKYYGFHTSCRAAADVIDEFREDGSRVRAETCPHYLVLDQEAYAEQGLRPTMAPPLRTADDQSAMFEYLRTGTLSVVSTDHVAFTAEQKAADAWWNGEFGINGLQHSLSLVHDEAVVERGFSYPALVRSLSTAPAETFGFERKGRIAPGMDADIVVFDPDETYTVSATENASAADYSVYDGRALTGRVKRTYLRGDLVAADGEVVADPGTGSYVPRAVPDWSA